jgi:multisubunit Na+/H+ antiporter MnhB subunit
VSWVSRKNNDDEAPDLRIELRKGWSVKPWQLAVIIIAGIVTYILVEFLKNILESRLMDNPNLIVLVIVIVLITVSIIVLYAIRKVSEK